jgi:dTDP-glucose 4,6-dehydratase
MTRSRLLVTGGAGFIGANFVHRWLRTRPESRVVVLDKLTYAGNLSSLEPVSRDARYRFVRGDIADRALTAELLDAESIDTIVHFAAESHVDRSIDGPTIFLETNVLGTHALLESARDYSARLPDAARAAFRFHHISTDEVFGSLGVDDPAFNERTPYAPNSPYAASKASSDHLARAYFRTYGLPVTITNCSNNYGPYQFPEKLIPLMIVHALEGRALPVYGDGLNRRDWLHVDDHLSGIEAVLDRGRVGESYLIGGGSELANNDLVRALCDRLDARFKADAALRKRFSDSPAARGDSCSSLITSVPDRLGHDRRYAIDDTKARTELGYRAAHSIEDGLDETIDWYLANESWWRPLLQRA